MSISSTNSDPRGDITNAKNLTPNLESPPNITGENTNQGLLTVIDMQERQEEDEKKQ